MNDLSSVSEIFVSSFSMRQSDGRLNLVKLFIFPCFVTTLHCYSVSLSIAFGQCAFGLLVHCLYNFRSMCASFLVFWLLNNSFFVTIFATNACLQNREFFLPDYRDRVKRGEFCPINWEACRRSFISFLSSVVEPAPGEKQFQR